jgi:hypothetical protein
VPLDASTLTTAIHAAFKKAKDTPPPADPSQADQAQEQILTQLAADLTSAIDTFVKSGDVVDVSVQVTDLTSHLIGTGTQPAGSAGKIQ